MSFTRLFALVLAASLFGPVATSAQDKITLGGVGSGSPIHWPAYIAIEIGRAHV